MSKESNIEVADDWFINERKEFDFLIVDDAEAPLDVSGYTIIWVVEGRLPVDIISKSGGSITVSNGAGTNDKVTVVVDAADTAALAKGWKQHALRRTDVAQVLSFGRAYLGAQPFVDA